MQAGEHLDLITRTTSARIRPGSVPGTWAITLESEPLPGTLAAFAGTLTAAHLSIVSAVVRVSEDRVADTFQVVPLDRASFDPEKPEQLAEAAADVLNGNRSIAAELAELRRRFPPEHHTEPEITTNTDSSLTTGVNVVAPDRPGLLYDVTSMLSRYGLRVRSLSVLTFSGHAHDTFRVVDKLGSPPTDPVMLEKLRADLAMACR